VRGTVTTLGRIRYGKLTLNGRAGSSLRSISSSSDLDETGYAVLPMADSTAAFVQHAINCDKYTGVVAKSLDLICNNPILDTCSIDTKMKVLSAYFDSRIKNHPQADKYEVFLMKIYIRSMSKDDAKTVITREEVSSRVLDLIQSYPKVLHSKVTEDTHFERDLGFDEFDCDRVQKALLMEFKTYIPIQEVVSCKRSIDYISKNRTGFQKFRDIQLCGTVFWPVPL
jgi:acyl carrier protein